MTVETSETTTTTPEKTAPSFEQDAPKKERKKREPNQAKIKPLGVHVDLIQYSNTLASITDDAGFNLDQNEAVNLGAAIERLTVEFDFNVNSKVQAIVNAVFLVVAITLRRKKNIMNLLKRVKNGKKEQLPADKSE